MSHPVDTLEIIVKILSVLGSLALFLYGMKTMSEALQKLGGEYLRRTFSKIALNRTKGFLTGFLVTGTIQSSTAVTVMLVSFVNAGLFTLDQTLSLMIGANVGTTITAWLITFIGFQTGFSVILLPIMACTLPLLFRKNRKYRYFAGLITGFVLIFTGFYFLKESLSSISDQTRFLLTISGLSDESLGTDLLFVGAGILLTIILRSSSATTALTMVMCYNGWMGFENAAAMIVGENIGTTFTANVAARIATNPARRLALAHTLFNTIGLIWCFISFNFFVQVTADFTFQLSGSSPLTNRFAAPFGLALFHSGFNLLNAGLVFLFYKWFNKLLVVIIPVKSNEGKKTGLRYIDTGYLSMSEMDFLQVQDEILHYGQHIANMFSLIPTYLLEKRDEKFLKIQKKLFKYEETADQQEIVLNNYLTKMAANDLTESGSRKVSSMLKMVDDMESIGDQCMQLEKTIRMKNEANAWLTPEMRDEILKFFDLVKDAINNMNFNLARDYKPGILVKATELELMINDARDSLITFNKKNVEAGQYSFLHAAFFNDIANQCEKIGDHIINVNQAIASNLK